MGFQADMTTQTGNLAVKDGLKDRPTILHFSRRTVFQAVPIIIPIPKRVARRPYQDSFFAFSIALNFSTD